MQDYEQWKPAPRRRAPWAIWLVLLLVVLPVAGVAAYTVARDPSLLDFTEPQPTRRPTIVALPSNRPAGNSGQSPSASGGPGTPGTPATPATPADASGPVARFAALAADPNVSLALRIQASITADGESLRLSMNVRQSGSDYAADMRMRMRGRSVTVKLIVKDDVAYARAPRRPWESVRMSELDLPSEPLAFNQLKVDQAVLVRSVTRSGKRLHLLRVPSTYAGGVDPAELRRMGCNTDDLSMQLWVRDDGTPVNATFDYTCVLRGERMVVSATYEFSKVNRPIRIQAPPKFR